MNKIFGYDRELCSNNVTSFAEYILGRAIHELMYMYTDNELFTAVRKINLRIKYQMWAWLFVFKLFSSSEENSLQVKCGLGSLFSNCSLHLKRTVYKSNVGLALCFQTVLFI